MKVEIIRSKGLWIVLNNIGDVAYSTYEEFPYKIPRGVEETLEKMLLTEEERKASENW